MTHAEILEKAIQKAIDGGWKADAVGMVTIIPKGWLEHDHYKAIIFNHDFAKALWGINSEPISSDISKDSELIKSIWQYHLQQMVIADDPVKYLGDNL